MTAASAESPWRVDVHAHILTEAFMAELTPQMPTMFGQHWPEWSPDTALERMDRWRIQTQIVSLTEPGLRLVTNDRRAEVARRCNEEMAELVGAHPARFGALAAVPLPDMNQAVAELRHAIDVLKLDGVGLLSSQDGLYLGDPAMEPLLEAMDERACWALVHPARIDHLPGIGLPPPSFEFPFDLTRSAVSLIINGVLARYPSIRWLLVQAGGTLPFLAPRLAAFMAMPPAMKADVGMPEHALGMSPGDMHRAIGSFYYDTALATGPSVMRLLRSITPRDHIVYGSDLPFARYAMGDGGAGSDPSPELSDTFSDEQRRGIERDHALAQLPRLARPLEDRTAGGSRPAALER